MERGEVYVIADTAGRVKVGYSHNAKRRISCIWSDSKPLRVIVVRWFEDRMARSAEKIAHQVLGIPVWVSGGNAEWFAVTPEQAVRAVNRAARLVRRFRRESGTVETSWKKVWKIARHQQGHPPAQGISGMALRKREIGGHCGCIQAT